MEFERKNKTISYQAWIRTFSCLHIRILRNRKLNFTKALHIASRYKDSIWTMQSGSGVYTINHVVIWETYFRGMHFGGQTIVFLGTLITWMTFLCSQTPFLCYKRGMWKYCKMLAILINVDITQQRHWEKPVGKKCMSNVQVHFV